MIILALIVIVHEQQGPIELTVVPEEELADQLGEQLEIETVLGSEDQDSIEEPIFTPDFLPEVEDPFAAPDAWEIVPDGLHATSDIEAPVIGLALKGREAGMKSALLGRYGGTALTQKAVARGLAWLVRNQLDDGSWSLRGPYGGGVHEQDENRVAATAMALLALQGDGNTHQEGPHRRSVTKAWNWLIRQQDPYGNFFHDGPYNHAFYTQGQCAIALCELYGMSEDEQFRERATKAIDYLLKSQSPQGGWRYTPRGDSDVSVTGWVVMALQSARMAGLEVPQENLDAVMAYLDKVAMHGGSRYPYQQGRQPTLPMTAEAILCRQYLGWPQDDERMTAALDWITQEDNLVSFEPNRRNTYYWYYATQACHHAEGEYWKKWNDVMRRELPAAQVKRGAESGSWDPDMNDRHEARAGRLYATCLCLYMLEVYYRHLPIYTNVYDELKR
jgi:hypothetical protein